MAAVSHMLRVAVTTSRRPTAVDTYRAERYAHALQSPFVPRCGLSFPEVTAIASQEAGCAINGALVVRWPLLTVWTPGEMLQYHPGMALHRVAGLRRGMPDTMVVAMELAPGDRVLDCTAGLASDAVVASYAVGPQGKVVCLESVAAIALLLKVGLAHYDGQGPELTAAMRRVRVRHCEHTKALANYAPGSFDIVYFDPMFATPVSESSGIAPLRPLADYAPLTPMALELALQVARRYVVVKDRQNGPMAERFVWDEIRGGRKSRIAYLVRRAGR